MTYNFNEKSILKGSLILLFTINLFNLINFVYNLVLARTLSLKDYGIFTSLNYIIIIGSILGESLQTITSKYSSGKNNGEIKELVIKFLKKLFKMILLTLPIYILFTYLGYKYFSYSITLLIITGVLLVLFAIIPIIRGIFQGRKMFFSYGTNFILEGFIKFISGLILLYLGFGVFGAMNGILIGAIAGFIYGLWGIRDILLSKRQRVKNKHIYGYSWQVLVFNITLLLFLTLDVLISNLFFTKEQVGIYALSSTIAKIIYLVTLPISKALLPISTELKDKNQAKSALKVSIIILSAISFLSLVVIYLAPEHIIKIYSGKVIYEASHILFNLAIASCMLGFSNMMIMYKLSRGIITNSYMLFIAIFLNITLLSILNKDLYQYSLASIISNGILIIISLCLRNKK
jgi:O-antigen/teichoic acid export membrane protein